MKKFSVTLSVLLLFCIIFSGCNSNKIKKSDIKGQITLKVTCQSAVDSGKRDEEAYKKIIPENGIIFETAQADFGENETIYDVLQRELENNNIVLNFTNGYIAGIGGLNEKDCGSESGWAFFVNDELPSEGCSTIIAKDGDVVEFRYLCTYAEWF